MVAPEKKIMVTSNLAMRFYTKHGWTLEELESLTDKNNGFHFWENDSEPYYIPNVGTNMNPERLAAKISQIRKIFDDFPGETMEECIKRFNW